MHQCCVTLTVNTEHVNNMDLSVFACVKMLLTFIGQILCSFSVVFVSKQLFCITSVYNKLIKCSFISTSEEDTPHSQVSASKPVTHVFEAGDTVMQ